MPRESANRALADVALVACPNCDLLQRLPAITPGQTACCWRCGTVLWRRRVDSLNRTLALAVAAAVLWMIANSVPMLGLTTVGREAFTTVIGGADLLWQHDQQIVAVLVFFAAVLAPALQIGVVLLVLLAARRERLPAWIGWVLRHLPLTRTWSMIEVMLLGVLVALTKIAEYATVIPGHALFALFALVFVLAAMQSSFDPREVWSRMEWAQADARPSPSEPPREASA
ncbi:MAG TPA: paraquat-inducible protein A [Candidatus Acidoferrum sp.]|nr:paraquat-inducible protein A [Candidatus Acidoferrum sp.]